MSTGRPAPTSSLTEREWRIDRAVRCVLRRRPDLVWRLPPSWAIAVSTRALAPVAEEFRLQAWEDADHLRWLRLALMYVT